MSNPSRRLLGYAKRILLSQPKRTDQQHEERLGVAAALAVFSADGLSSVAYATEEVPAIPFFVDTREDADRVIAYRRVKGRTR